MIDSKIDEIAHNMGIKDWLDRPAFDLSGGQRSKILLAKFV